MDYRMMNKVTEDYRPLNEADSVPWRPRLEILVHFDYQSRETIFVCSRCQGTGAMLDYNEPYERKRVVCTVCRGNRFIKVDVPDNL